MRTGQMRMAAKSRRAPRGWLIVLAATLVVGGLMLRGALAAGATGDTGYRGQSFGAGVTGADPNDGPTGEKPQNKLWFNDGTWWGILFNASAGQYRIYRLALTTQAWTDTGVVLDARRYSHADALWDGTHLYVATASQPGKGNADANARVLRFSYNTTAQAYSLDAGFPVIIAAAEMEAIGIAKDTTGMVWVTYTYDNGSGGRSALVAHTAGSDTAWTTPYVLPATGANNLTSDDISALVAYSGQIGVMWSNQNAGTMYFASHADGTSDNWWVQNPALQGPQYADDHINLKSLQADSAGVVFAAVKTSLNDPANADPNAPLLLLLILDGHGGWQRRTFATVSENMTRPIVMIDEGHRNLYMFATTNNGNPPSAIIYKQTSLDNINFPSGQGTPFLQSLTDTNINNATSTRDILNGQTGLVILASDLTTGNYWHNYLDLSGATPIPTVSATNTAYPLNTQAPTATATNTPLPPTATPTGGAPTATPTATAVPPTATPTAVPNVALNRPAVASSLESSSYPASNAVDGNTGTRWSSQFSDPQWIYVDLGGTYAVSRVRLIWEAAYGKAYQIQVSNDATTWTTIYSTTTGTGGTNDLSVSGTGRYVRMYGTVRGTVYGYSLWEFEVYGVPGIAPTATPTATPAPPTATPTPTATGGAPTTTNTPLPPTATPTPTGGPLTATPTATGAPPTPTPTATVASTVNLALNRPAVASSLESSSYPASNAVDGNTGTRWSSQFSDPQWIYVDLGQIYTFSRVRLIWETAYGKAYQIQVSNDAATWTTIYSTTTGTGGTNNLAVSGTGRYVRMYGTQRGTVWGYSLWEFQVYP